MAYGGRAITRRDAFRGRARSTCRAWQKSSRIGIAGETACATTAHQQLAAQVGQASSTAPFTTMIHSPFAVLRTHDEGPFGGDHCGMRHEWRRMRGPGVTISVR